MVYMVFEGHIFGTNMIIEWKIKVAVWYWFFYFYVQWCRLYRQTTLLGHLTEKIILHLISIILTKECNDTTMMLLVQMQNQWCPMTNEVTLHLISIVLTYSIQWCHWQHWWHHVTPVPVVSMTKKSCCTSFQSSSHKEYSGAIFIPLVSHDPDASTSGTTWQKSHVAPHHSYLNVLNATVLLMMLLVSCDTDVSANCIKLPKS